LKSRDNVKVPETVECICAVGLIGKGGYLLVPASSQWSEDFQGQGIPCVVQQVAHFKAMDSRDSVDLIANLIRARHPRRTAAQTAAARKQLLPDDE
jgi:hypothetical protein